MDVSLINPSYRLTVVAAAAATGLAVAAVLAPWEAVRIIGVTVFTGMCYGIVNDMIACRDCIEYFTVGHGYDGRNLKKHLLCTLNPTLTALVWGIAATWHVCAIAGVCLALVARIPFPGLTRKITAAQMAPYLAISAAITLLIAHIKSRQAQAEIARDPYVLHFGVPLQFQAGWEACEKRNETGYNMLPFSGIILLVGTIVARTGLLPIG